MMANEAPDFGSKVSDHQSDTNSPGIILMCRKCNSVVADSMAWVCANRELSTITVHSVTKKVFVKEVLSTSGEGPDIGSTFTNITCNHCDSTVGKVYKTTPRHMDEMRDLFTLDVNALECYQIGGPDVQKADIELDKTGLMGSPAVKPLVTQMNKMHTIMLGFNERIAKLEEMMKDRADSTEQPTEEDDKENFSDASSCEITRTSALVHRDNSEPNKSITVSRGNTSTSHLHKTAEDVKPDISKLNKKRVVDLGMLEKQRLHKKKKK